MKPVGAPCYFIATIIEVTAAQKCIAAHLSTGHVVAVSGHARAWRDQLVHLYPPAEKFNVKEALDFCVRMRIPFCFRYRFETGGEDSEKIYSCVSFDVPRKVVLEK